jgi:hypothetical protein
MKLCANGHQPIVFESSSVFGFIHCRCPLCDAKAEILAYQREIEAYRKLEGAVVTATEGHAIKSISFHGQQPS